MLFSNRAESYWTICSTVAITIMRMRDETAHAQSVHNNGGCKKSDAGADEKLKINK